MEAINTTGSDLRRDGSTSDTASSEWNARGLRPVAHWVLMPTSGGRRRLSMVWEVPDPIPPGREA